MSIVQQKKKRLFDLPDHSSTQMVPNINKILPAELLENVFNTLSHDDLKSALLVCRRWRGVGEYRKLWSWVTLEVTLHNLPAMSQALATARLMSMTELTMRTASQELLEAIAGLFGQGTKVSNTAIVNHPGLKVLYIYPSDLSTAVHAEPVLLAKIVNKMKQVDFGGSQLTDLQIQAIFDEANGESKLKKLYLSNNDLSSVDPENLAKFVTNLKWVVLCYSQMTPLQCQTIFDFAYQETKLVELDLEGNDLSTVNAEKLSSVVAKLEEIGLGSTNLTSHQCKKIFRLAATENKLKLKTLFIEMCDLSSVNPRNLSTVVSKLNSVYIYSTSLTPVQCAKIFKAIASDTSKLDELIICNNDLSAVNANILAKAVSKLSNVGLSNCELTTLQCNEIFENLSSDWRLEILNIYDNDLSEINPELMAQVMPKLEEVGMNYADLTPQQCQIIFQQQNLRKLNFVGNDLELVDQETIDTLSAKLELNI